MTNATILLLAALSWGQVAWAQSAAAPDPFTLAPPQGGALVQGWGVDPLAPERYALALSLHTRPTPTGAEAEAGGEAGDTARVFGTSTVELLGGIGGFAGFDIWGGMTAVNANEDGTRLDTRVPASPGHARLLPRLSLSAPAERQRAALMLDLALPLRGDMLASEGVHVEPRLALSRAYAWVQPLLNTGYRVHIGGNRGRDLDAFTWVAGAVVPIGDEWSGVAELAGRWYPHASQQPWPERLPTEARAAARFARASWAVELGAGSSLIGGGDAPNLRLFAAVSISPAPQPAPHDPQRPKNPSSSLARADDECAMALVGWKGSKIPAACEVSDLAPTHEPDCTERGKDCEAPPAVAVCDGSEAPASPNCGATPTAPPEPPLPQIDARVYFAPNSTTVDPSDQSVLDRIARQMSSAAPELRFRVVGHSDTTGPAAFNWQLSEARAVFVRRLLLQRGVPWRRVTVGWYGPTRPLEDGTDPEINAKNRRVEFKVERARGEQP